jgi:hypothetical protein
MSKTNRRWWVLILPAIFTFYGSYCQNNLVLNPSFEWFGSSVDSAYFECSGTYLLKDMEGRCIMPEATGQYAPAKSFHGKVYMPLVLKEEIGPYDYRIKNVQSTFCKQLDKDAIYQVSFYIKPGDDSYLAKSVTVLMLDSLQQINFFIDRREKLPLNSLKDYAFKIIPLLNSTDTYQRVQFDYTAKGGERYIYLGNFNNMPESEFIKWQYIAYKDPFRNKRQMVSYNLDMLSVIPYSKHEECEAGELVENNPHPSVLQIGKRVTSDKTITLDTIQYHTKMDGNKVKWDCIFSEIQRFDFRDTIVVRWYAFDKMENGDKTMAAERKATENWNFLSRKLPNPVVLEGRYVPGNIYGESRSSYYGITEVAVCEFKKHSLLRINQEPIALDTIHYETNLDESNNGLDNLVVKLSKYDVLDTVFVIGYTDSVGNSEDNMALSFRRAQKVSEFLKTKTSNPIIVEGRGFASPIEKKSNSGSNRRTEIIVRGPNKEEQ